MQKMGEEACFLQAGVSHKPKPAIGQRTHIFFLPPFLPLDRPATIKSQSNQFQCQAGGASPISCMAMLLAASRALTFVLANRHVV